MENKDLQRVDYLLGGRELLNEAVNISSAIKRIEKATDDNDHTGSVLIAAREIAKDKKLVAALEAVKTIQDYFGHMPSGLIDVRTELRKGMLAALKGKISKEDLENLEGAF